MRKVVLGVGIALLATMLFVLTLSAVSASKPTKVTSEAFGPGEVDISDDYIVWMDYRYSDSEVFSYNIAGGVTERVTNYNGRDEEPKVFHDRVVWNTDYYTLTVKNLTNGTSWTFHTGTSSDRGQEFDIHGDHVLYVRYQYISGSNYYRLMLVNVSAQTAPVQLWTTGANDNTVIENIHMYKDKAVVLVRYSQNITAFFIDIPSKTIERMVTVPGDSYQCWVGGFNARTAIFRMNYGFIVYNYTAKTWSPLDLGLTSLDWMYIDVNGKKLVYSNIPTNGNAPNIFLYNLDTKETVRLTNSPYSHIVPVIWGERVAFISSEEGVQNIYLIKLFENPPDLSIMETGVIFNPPQPVIGQPLKVQIEVKNLGHSVGKGRIYLKIGQDDGSYIETSKDTPALAPDESYSLEFDPVTIPEGGYKEFDIFVEQVIATGHEEEIDLGNNHVVIIKYVNDLPRPAVVPSDSLNLTVQTNEEIQFTSQGSWDKDGINLYAWDFGDGTGAIGAVSFHSWSNDGTYKVRLTVYDTFGSYNTTTVTVVVNNRPPEAIYNVPNIVGRDRDVVFSAAGSWDPDGVIKSVEWTIDGLGEDLVGTVVTHSFNTIDDLVNVTLILIDDDGARTQVNLTLSVVEPTWEKIPPVAVIQLTGNGGVITLSGSASYDVNGEVVEFKWVVENKTLLGETVEHVFLEGTYFISLTVKDDEGLTGSSVTAITINYTEPPKIIQNLLGNTTVINQVRGNLAPTLSASLLITDKKAGTVSCTGSGSDPDGSIVRYEWDFDGDGIWDFNSTSTGNTAHTYPAPGYYVAIFRVSDNNGTSTMKVLSVAIRTSEIGGKGSGGDGNIGASTLGIILTVVVVMAIVISVAVAWVSAKKIARKQIDTIIQAKTEELRSLLEVTRSTGAKVDEAEALLRELKGE